MTVKRFFYLSNTLLAHEIDWWNHQLVEENLLPMLIEIECKPHPRRPMVTHCPQLRQVADIVEPITGANEYFNDQ